MVDYGYVASCELRKFYLENRDLIAAKFLPGVNGNVALWDSLLNLPEFAGEFESDCKSRIIKIFPAGSVGEGITEKVRNAAEALKPWRKGPFYICGILIDAEWRSFIKWKRVKNAVGSFLGKTVFDIGSGNGYYALKAVDEGADYVLAVEPTMVYLYQFYFINKFLKRRNIALFPLRLEEVKPSGIKFDLVFSMGLLYHQKDPIGHLIGLRNYMHRESLLILETLTMDGGERELLFPEGRYARMKNVWFIPSPSMLKIWLGRAGYTDIEVVDISKTESYEQHSVKWISVNSDGKAESLKDFLSPQDKNFTIEGYPAPKRLLARCRYAG